MWCVIYANGHKEYFASEETARAEAFERGIGIIAPLYRAEV